MFLYNNPFLQPADCSQADRHIEFIKAITLRRIVYLTLGLLFLGVAAVGVVTPGIPTTGPLLLASFLLTKSCPALEKRLIRNRFFGRYLMYLDGSQAIPPQTRRNAIVAMWGSISLSCLVSIIFMGKGSMFAACLLLAGVVGHFCILRFRLPRN